MHVVCNLMQKQHRFTAWNEMDGERDKEICNGKDVFVVMHEDVDEWRYSSTIPRLSTR